MSYVIFVAVIPAAQVAGDAIGFGEPSIRIA